MMSSALLWHGLITVTTLKQTHHLLKGKKMKIRLDKKISDKVLDDLVRKYIRLISGGYCKRCKKYVGGAIQVSHLYGRRRKTVRWDLRNVHPLCPDCHYLIDNDHLLKTSFQFDVLNQKEIEELEKLANMTIKEHPIDREQIKQELKEKIALLEEK